MTASAIHTSPRPPLRLGWTILHLALLGSLGAAILTGLSILIAFGVGLIIVFGVGLLVLLGVLYALFGLAWFEVERVGTLYHLPIASLRWRPRQKPGFAEYLRSLGRNLSSGRMWAAMGILVIACFLGAAMLKAFEWIIRTGILAFAPMSELQTVPAPFGVEVSANQAPWLGLVALVLAAVVVGLALLHQVISSAIIGAIARESDLSHQVRTITVQREGAMRAAEVERTRIERDLHDGVQPRLVSVGMTLGLAQQQVDHDPQQAKALIGEAHTSTKSAITELRQLTRGIYASVLEDRGLDAALSAVASRSHVPVTLDVRLQGRAGHTAEAAVYFAIAEALTNAAKHSQASQCRVTVRTRDDGELRLWARVEDDGVGGARVVPGGGLDGISNRVAAAGGTLTLDSPAGGPTALEVSVPCAS